jgi:hypothetical protein
MLTAVEVPHISAPMMTMAVPADLENIFLQMISLLTG